MVVLVADYRADWQPLSKQHEKIDIWLREIIENYASRRSDRYSYSIIGTFGAGKTQLLYHIYKMSLSKNLLPIFLGAEDLFRDIIVSESVVTAGDLTKLVRSKIDQITGAIVAGNTSGIRTLLDPRGKMATEAPEMMELLRIFYGSNPKDIGIVLLIDELEGQYPFLQTKVKTMDRSPLRDWLEDRTYMKFMAFAPGGIYELGGADTGRITRIVLPSADIEYVRDNFERNPGRSNSCWWLSRGKARQLFKTYEIIKNRGPEPDPVDISRFIKYELDPIGQPPTVVPAADTEKLSPSKIPFLMSLQPIPGEKSMRYVINAKNLDTAKLSERLIQAFHINKDNSMLISDYFRRTVKALSDEEWTTYVGSDELPELFSLVFDHLLEYEHGSPEISTTLADVLNLYDRVRRDSASLHGIVGVIWELKEVEFKLPLKISEIRDAFPFPSMNPIVKGFLPEDVKTRWLGKGVPIWFWNSSDTKVLFFPSESDFVSYVDKDAFISDVLPDGRTTLCLFPPGHAFKGEKPILNWLEENGKLTLAELPGLLTDFLLSAAGTIDGSTPGDLTKCLEKLKQEKEDILLKRRSEIYSEAIDEKVAATTTVPTSFCKSPPPDASTVWGKGQMADRDLAIYGLALAFADITDQEKEQLTVIRDLFRSGKEGRGAGDLNKLAPRGGFISIADDLLPRYLKKKELRDAEPVGRLKGYWRDEEKIKLIALAQILPVEHFLKIDVSEDPSRVLEALWRTVRMDFEPIDTTGLLTRLESEVKPALEDCHKLEETLKKDFGITGINYDNLESLVAARLGITSLIDTLQQSIADTGTSALLARRIVGAFCEALLGTIGKDIKSLASEAGIIKRTLQDLLVESDNLGKNFFEYPKAVKFAGTSQAMLEKTVMEQKTFTGTQEWSKLHSLLEERKDILTNMSSDLGKLEKKLNDLKGLFEQVKQ